MSLGESHDSVEYVTEVQEIISDEEEGEIKSGEEAEEEGIGGAWRHLIDDDEEEENKKRTKKKGKMEDQHEENGETQNGATSNNSTPKSKYNDEDLDRHRDKRAKHDDKKVEVKKDKKDSKGGSQPASPQPEQPKTTTPPPTTPTPSDKDNTNISTSTPTANTPNETETKEEVIDPPKPLIRQNLVIGCRHVDNFKRLNKIEEGTYGVVYRAQDKESGEIVALKKLKMDREKEGFPITSLREIKILLTFKHPNIVDVREVVVGNNLNSIFIVMEFVDHDIKTLMEDMPKPFLPSEVKCLIKQLLQGMAHLHDNWVLHRDLKTSNLLYNNKGMLKIADFGLAREYGSPLKPYSLNIVTLWYRAPELLLGAKQYTTAVDMWSVGCIFAELISKQALLQGRTEIDQIDKIFRLLGTANEKIWPGFSKLANVKKMSFVNQPYNNLRQKFPPTTLTESGFDLLNKFLTYDPVKRITAAEALKHPYFSESPPPKDTALMPTWPSTHDGIKRKRPLDEVELREQQRERELQQQSEQDRFAHIKDRTYAPAPPAPAPAPFVLKGTFGFMPK